MRFCRAAHPAGDCSVHSARVSGWRRNMPSPLQGASTRIASKNPAHRGASCSGSAETTSPLVTPIRSRLRLEFSHGSVPARC